MKGQFFILALCLVRGLASPTGIGMKYTSNSNGNSDANSDTGSNTNSNPSSNSDSQNAGACYINGQAVQPGKRATVNDFVFECQTSGNSIRSTIVACMDDGSSTGSRTEHNIGDRWPEGKEKPFKYIVECAKQGDTAMKQLVQCFYDSDDGQAKLNPGSKQTVGKTTVQCTRTDGGGLKFETATGDATGGGDGTMNLANSNSGDSNTKYTRTDSNTNVQMSGSATCYANGQPIKPGERTTVDDFVFECQVDGNRIRTAIVACLDDGSNGGKKSEHKIGDQWVEGDKKPFKYVITCAKNGNIVGKQMLQCFYDSDEGQAKLSPGESKVVGTTTVKCSKTADGGLRYDTSRSGSTDGTMNVDSNGQTMTQTNTNTKYTTNTGSSDSTNPKPNPSGAVLVDSGSDGGVTITDDSNGNTQQTSNMQASSSATCYGNGQPIKPGQRLAINDFVFECQVDGNQIRTAIVACLDSGSNGGKRSEHKIGEQWTEGRRRPFKYVYQCAKDGDQVGKKMLQCYYDADEGQAAINPGETKVVGQTTVQCSRTSNGGLKFDTSMGGGNTVNAPTGSNTNTKYTNGDKQAAGTCSVGPGNQQVPAGQNATVGNFVYSCRQSDDGGTQAVIVACLDDQSKQYSVGRQWQKGDRPNRYIMECSRQGDDVQARVIQCFYDSDEGAAKLDIGSEQTVGSTNVRCDKSGDYGATISTHAAGTLAPPPPPPQVPSLTPPPRTYAPSATGAPPQPSEAPPGPPAGPPPGHKYTSGHGN